MHVKRKDGSEIWLRSNVNVRRGGEGNIIGYEGVFEDVTERVELERKIRDFTFRE